MLELQAEKNCVFIIFLIALYYSITILKINILFF